MADEQEPDQPSLELPSLFKRKHKPAPAPVETVETPRTSAPQEPPVETPEPETPARRPRRQMSLPTVAPLPAAAVTGVLVGFLAVGLTWLALRACTVVRDTSSCGDPGFLLLLAIVVLMALAGRALLGAWRVPDAGSTSLLATALTAVLSMLFLMGSLGDTWTVVALPVLGAVTFAVAQWVTATNTAPGDRPR